MPTLLRVYTNEDDALLFWATTAHINNCRGFAIERKITRRGRQAEDHDFLPNRIGFAKEQPKPDTEGKGPSEPSTVWPFQRFSWTDHDANAGDTVSYRVVPIVRDSSGKLVRREIEASAFSDPRTLGMVPAGSKYRAFFNRGFVMSQFMARYLKQNKLTLKQFKTQIGKSAGQAAEHTIRNFLAGRLRTAILDLLATGASDKTEIYAALFELSDEELVAGLVKRGKRAHVVLANGSIQRGKGEKPADARTRDENQQARAALIKAKVDVQPKNRFISPGALAHNKFLVVVDGQGRAVRVWTGSTNWAPTGLCTQVNNGLLVDDPAIAKLYLDQWHRLRKAASDFPDDLVASNSQPHQSGNATVWFTRAKKQVDLAALNAEVAKAKQGILFLMFMPGATGVLGNVMKRAQEPGLWVRGVVSELPNGHNDESKADVHLVNGQDAMQLSLDIIQPEGVKHPMANFAAEVTRTQFLSQVGHAIVHSKVLVIDPFGDAPVVITGSHNFSASASSKNDENFIIVRGDKALAEAYAVNIEGAYQHYRWRAYLDQTDKPFEGLVDNDTWQDRKLAGARKELDFWGVGLGHVV